MFPPPAIGKTEEISSLIIHDVSKKFTLSSLITFSDFHDLWLTYRTKFAAEFRNYLIADMEPGQDF